MMANSFPGPGLGCFLAAIITGAFAVGASAQQLPDGPGKSDLEMVCTACHGEDQITLKGPRTPRQWEQMVAQMKSIRCDRFERPVHSPHRVPEVAL